MGSSHYFTQPLPPADSNLPQTFGKSHTKTTHTAHASAVTINARTMLSFICLFTCCLFTPQLAAEETTDESTIFPKDPVAAVERWRVLQYQGLYEPVIADLAPAAPGWVDRRSIKATKQNVERLSQNVYGYEIIAGAIEGDAACVMLRAAWTDKKKPEVAITPFYLWWVNDRWTFLPNPLAVETWYQSVPDDLEPGYDRLASWYEKTLADQQDLLADDAADLIAQWRQEMTEKDPADDHPQHD